jgi:hypothetical protein
VPASSAFDAFDQTKVNAGFSGYRDFTHVTINHGLFYLFKQDKQQLNNSMNSTTLTQW